MKKLRFILLSAVLTAVFGFSFIGCSNYSSNGSSSNPDMTGSSNHDMTIRLKDASNVTYTYYADYATNDNFAKTAQGPQGDGFTMKVFKSDGTEISDNSVYIDHYNEKWYKLTFNDETGRRVQFQTTAPYKFTPRVNSGFGDSKIVELTINGNRYDLEEND